MSGRGIKGPDDQARAIDIEARFRRGETLQAIGDVYGVSRERVRQILKKYRGVTGRDGGQHKAVSDNRIVAAARRDERYLRNKGVTYAQYRMLVLLRATRAYSSQEKNAKKRGIEWRFNLGNWWAVWESSGRWFLRGKGQGKYCMARNGDSGAYEPNNVFICLAVENNSNRPQKKSGLPMGVHHRGQRYKSKPYAATKMCGGKSYYVGVFSDPISAHRAYLAFNG